MLNRLNGRSIIIVIFNFGKHHHHEAKICLAYINYKERYCSSSPETCNLGFDQIELILRMKHLRFRGQDSSNLYKVPFTCHLQAPSRRHNWHQ